MATTGRSTASKKGPGVDGRGRGSKRAYHHRDLPNAMLAALEVHLRTHAPSTVRVDAIARAVRVSSASPYHHFRDREALLAAFAQQGFERWIERARRVAVRRLSPQARFAALVRAWLSFARTSVSHHRVLFLAELSDRERFARLHELRGLAIAPFVSALEACLPTASRAARGARAATTLAALQGLVELERARAFDAVVGLGTARSRAAMAQSQVLAMALAPLVG